MKTAWNHIRRSPYQALAAIFVMIQTFFVGAMLLVLGYGFSSSLHYYETKPQIIAYLKNDSTPDQVSSLQRKLESDERIINLHYVSKEQALEIYKKATASNPLLTEFLSPDVLPASLEFSVSDLKLVQLVINEVKQDKIVDDINFTASLGSSNSLQDTINQLSRISNYIRIGGGVVLGILLASSLLILLVIISMRVSSRKDEIEILQLLGATPGFIRTPFLIEGIFYAVSGALIGWLFSFLIILYLFPGIKNFFQEVPFLPTDMPHLLIFFAAILGIEVLVALIIGMVSSFIAIKRYLKI